MRKYLFIILCASVALSIVANDRVITREHLRMATKEAAPTGRLVSSSDRDAQVSLPRVLQECNLTLDDNKFNRSASLRGTTHHVMGEKILMVDTYDFDWDSVASVAAVVDTSYFMQGKMTQLSHYASSWSPNVTDDVYMVDFYQDFRIPIDVDSINGYVCLWTGVPLVEITGNYEVISGGQTWFSDRTSSDSYWRVTRRLYAMPESWLAGDDAIEDIYGSIYGDGSISLQGGFGFLIEREETYVNNGVPGQTEVSWGLSPIFRNFYMLTPNAVHEYKGQSTSSSSGGCVANLVELVGRIGYTESTTGGVVRRPINPRPVKPKPVNPRPINHSKLCVAHGGNDCAVEPGRDSEPDRGMTFSVVPRVKDYSQPVYIYQQDDTTLLVYNLFGKDYSWNYIITRPDGSVSLPSQPMGYYSSKNEIIYNGSMVEDSIQLDNEGILDDSGAVTWNDTYFFTESGMQNYHYWDNRLYFTDGSSFVFLSAPVFAEPQLTDNTVTFTATAGRSDATVYIIEYDPVEYGIIGDNPDTYTVTREAEPRTVYLYAYAEALNGEDWIYSDFTEFEYEVPAFFMPGDVNGDRTVSIADITVLIDYLLDEQSENINALHHNEADVNRDGIIGIADVADLIDQILSVE